MTQHEECLLAQSRINVPVWNTTSMKRFTTRFEAPEPGMYNIQQILL